MQGALLFVFISRPVSNVFKYGPIQSEAEILGLKKQSRPSVSNITSADVRLTTPLNSARSMVNVTNSI